MNTSILLKAAAVALIASPLAISLASQSDLTPTHTVQWSKSQPSPHGLLIVKSEQEADTAVRFYLQQQQSEKSGGQSNPAVPSLSVVSSKRHADGGVTIYEATQQWNGLPVFNTSMKFVARPDGSLIASAGALVSDATLAGSLVSKGSQHTDVNMRLEQGLRQLLTNSSIQVASVSRASASHKSNSASDSEAVKHTAEIMLDGRAHKVELVLQEGYFARGDQVLPATQLQIFGKASSGLHHVLWVDAQTGDLLRHSNRLKDIAYQVYAAPNQLPLPGPQGYAGFPHPDGAPNGLNLGEVPAIIVDLESGPISTNDPWLGPGSTITSGNNTQVYLDVEAPNGFTPGSLDRFAPMSSANSFVYDYNFTTAPSGPQSQNAAMVQAFYTVNFMHDWFYDNGFREIDGNAQTSNFGRGGLSNDPILVELQDFDGTNNANISVPLDGTSPRMQLFLFDGNTNHSMAVDSPANLLDQPETGRASFGPTSYTITGNLVLVDDGVVAAGEDGASSSDACETPFVNAAAVAGNIALIDRGVCFFVEKVSAAEAAGAIAVVIINNVEPGVITMGAGDTPPVINIPSLMVTLPDGNTIKTALASGQTVTVTMNRATGPSVDSGLDNGLIAHEWGHFLNNRLIDVGSSTQSNGMDEGWADFAALLLLIRAEDAADDFSGTYAIAGFADSGNDRHYYGLRRVPYTVDFSKNALTFKHIANGEPLPSNVATRFGLDGADNAEVHATGEVWATMLLECYVGLLTDGRHSFSEAQERMKNYLVAGHKATPANPTFVTGRDAFLAVIQAADQVDFEVCRAGFARRGLGIGAVAPPLTSDDNSPVVESFASTPPPAVEAGPAQTVNEGDAVTLSGSSSDDPSQTEFTYAWTQTSGPTVTLSGADTPTASFTSPQVTAATNLRFTLTVTNTDNVSGADTVQITVNDTTAPPPPSPAPPPAGGGGGGGGSLPLGIVLLLIAVASRKLRG